MLNRIAMITVQSISANLPYHYNKKKSHLQITVMHHLSDTAPDARAPTRTPAMYAVDANSTKKSQPQTKLNWTRINNIITLQCRLSSNSLTTRRYERGSTRQAWYILCCRHDTPTRLDMAVPMTNLIATLTMSYIIFSQTKEDFIQS